MQSRSRSQLALCAILLCASLAGAETRLPRPDGLAPAVSFWERVYSEVGTDGGLIHDSEYLDVVYEVIRIPDGLSRRSREKRIEGKKDKIRAALKKLAKGKRTGLSAFEAEVLSRWPPGTTDSTLRRAEKNVRFQLGQADRFREGLVRSGAWLDDIQHTLRKYGVPLELASLPHVESSFNPDAYSRVGAAGLWQFTRSTGRQFLRIDSVVDERLDPWKASDAAARLLVRNHEITESWPLAITAYNHGAAGMRRAARQLGTKDIVTIVRKYNSRSFGFASRNFYTSLLAAVSVDSRAAEIFGEIRADPRVEYTLIEMPHYYRAASLSAALGVDTDTLRKHNGALRPDVWQGNKYVPSGFKLRVPSAALSADPPTLLARVPANERITAQHRDRFHKVRRGQTLSIIARKYGVSQSTLVRLNHLRSRHRIRVGQVLALPSGVAPPIAVAKQDKPADGIYTVRRGDKLSIIARRFDVTESALVKENRLRSRHRITVGQRLKIPGAGPVVIAAAAPAAKPEPVPVQVAKPAPEPEPEPVQVAKPEPEPEPVQVAKPAPEPEPVPVQVAKPAPEPKPEPVQVAKPTPTPEPEPVQIAKAVPVPKPPAKAKQPVAEPVVVAKAEPAPLARASLAEPTSAPASESGAPDPSDYEVHDERVTVQAAETLGHYAEWLEIRASALRRKNKMRYEQPIVIGRRVRLTFDRVTPEEFERRRLEYHRTLQDEFFSSFEVTGTEQHVLLRGESLWYLAERKYRVPIWLLRQYNPELNFASLPAGAALVVPVVEPRTS